MKILSKKLFNWIYNKYHSKFLIILSMGIILRIIALIILPISRDTPAYIYAAEGIISGDYREMRQPSFPLLIVPFLLITGDPNLAVKLASFFAGFFAIIASYLVFSKSALKIFENDENGRDKSYYIGLLVSFLLSINFNLVYNNGRGLREEFIMLLLILIFYHIFVINNAHLLRNHIILFFLIVLLNLAHEVAGIVMYTSIFFLYLSQRINIFNFNNNNFKLSNSRMFLITFSLIISYIFWFTFCLYNFGDPLYTYNYILQHYSKINPNFNFSSLDLIFTNILNNIKSTIAINLWSLFYIIGPIFILVIILSFFKYYHHEQILFLYFLIIIYFLFLSVLISMSIIINAIRSYIFVYPFIFFLGSFLIIELWFEKEKQVIVSLKVLNKKLLFTSNYIFLLYLLTIVLSNFIFIFVIFKDKDYPNTNSIINVILLSLSYSLLFIHEFFLVLLLKKINILIIIKS